MDKAELPPTGDFLGYMEKNLAINRGHFKILDLPQRIVNIDKSSQVYIGADGIVIAPSDTDQAIIKLDHLLTIRIVDAIARFTTEPDNPALFNFIKQLNANMKDTTT